MLVSRAQELSPCSSSTLTLTSSCTFLSTLCSSNPFLSFLMRYSLSFLRSLSPSPTNPTTSTATFSFAQFQPHFPHLLQNPRNLVLSLLPPLPLLLTVLSSNTWRANPKPMRIGILITVVRARQFLILIRMMGPNLKHFPALALDVKELEELPEQWRRSKLVWLCKELLAHKAGTLVQMLNAQRKWMRQADATFVAVHCFRICENEAGFKVYKWMMQQHRYQFDFSRYQAS